MLKDRLLVTASSIPHILWGHSRFEKNVLPGPTWSLLLLLTAPGFFFFLIGLRDVSEGEWPLEEWVGLDTFLFWGATGRSADPEGSGTGGQSSNRRLVFLLKSNSLDNIWRIKISSFRVKPIKPMNAKTTNKIKIKDENHNNKYDNGGTNVQSEASHSHFTHTAVHCPDEPLTYRVYRVIRMTSVSTITLI